MAAWDPSAYLAFAGPRLQPALDLLAAVDLDGPGNIVDLGCGAGNVTGLLAERWPEARITGIDSSPEMLAEARAAHPEIIWIEADIGAWSAETPPDLIFSTAALHWLPDHARLFPRLVESVRPDGVLAVQMPRNFDEPSHTAITEAIDAGPWRDRLADRRHRRPVAEPDVYRAMLAPLTDRIDVWETVYEHVLEGDDPVVRWTRSTALRPVLDQLDADEQTAFLVDYAARVGAAYPRRADGTTLFPFCRLFIIARRYTGPGSRSRDEG